MDSTSSFFLFTVSCFHVLSLDIKFDDEDENEVQIQIQISCGTT